MIKDKLYFFSDFHLGMPPGDESIDREKVIVSILKKISSDARAVFFVGDIFDFWFEYKEVVPKGYFRLFTAITELTHSGVSVYLFPGNHDLWYRDYLVNQCGVVLISGPMEFYFAGSKFHVHHGDGLGPGDKKYKLLKRVFLSKISVFFFKWLHPDIGISLARYLSSKSRLSQKDQEQYLGDDKEFLTQYCKDISAKKTSISTHYSKNDLTIQLVENNNDVVNYFVFGHRHLLLTINIGDSSKYINLGHWLKNPRYGVFDGKEFLLVDAKEESSHRVR